MPSQLTVRLPDDLDRALKAAARRMQRKNSDVVRLALREFLGASGRPRGRPIDRVRALVWVRWNPASQSWPPAIATIF